MNTREKKPRIIFMGSPEFALASLNALHEHFDVVGVVAQPDRPAERGRELMPPPVKSLALKLGIPVFQPKKLRAPEAVKQLKDWSPDLIVVAAYGQILSHEVLDIPEFGSVNVHASLLPRWRGAAPIQAAILHGDAQSGVSIMRMDPGLDTGPILSQREIELDPNETADSLSNKLAELGAELLIDTLPGILVGEINAQVQDGEQSTYAPMLKKSDGELDVGKPAAHLARQVRAYHPWPGTYLKLEGGLLIVHQAHAVKHSNAEAGLMDSVEGLPAIGTADGYLVLDKVQPAGKKQMGGSDFLRGARDWNGHIKPLNLKEKM